MSNDTLNLNKEAFTGERIATLSDDVMPPWPDKPVIRLEDANFKENCEQAEQILAPYIYAHAQGTKLVRIGRAHEFVDEEVDRDPEQCFLLEVTGEYIQRQLSGVAIIERHNAKEKAWKRTSCPEWLAKNILKHGNSPHFRQLDAITRAPFIRSDGSVCDEPGYDARSRSLYEPNAEFLTLADSVSFEDAQEALGILLHPFRQFPFANEAARSAFVVHILTEAARLALDRVPCFFYTAQYQGTGKSLLSEMPATIVHGVEPALRDWVEGDELRKTLFSSVICGDRSIAFDNLGEGAKVRARELCKFITEAAAADRKLGESKILTAVNRAVVSLSGNNINPTGDLSRRALVVRMDANMTLEELKARVFEIENLRGHILERRPQLLDAALTIIRGYQQQHGHNGPPAMQSFENWSRMVRDPLIWLGMEDPLETQKQETEDDSGHIDDAFKLLARQYADRDFTATDVARIVGGLTDANGELGKTLIQAGCAEPNDTTKLGYWLRACRDKRGAGVKLVKGGSKYKGSGNIWRFEAIRKAQNPAAVPTDEPNGDLI